MPSPSRTRTSSRAGISTPTPDNFALTMNVSCYSFTAVAQRAVPLMKNGGSLLTLTYYGAERVIPHYNVMGVAKAALEASVRYLAMDLGEQKITSTPSPLAVESKTLAFSGIGDALHPALERAQLAAQAQCRAQGGRQCRPLPPVGSRHRRDR